MKIRCVKANEETRRKTRIAVYCRVSTKRTVQEDSLEMQKEAYQKRIALRSDWELVGIYADSLSGLSAEKRLDFMRLIEDCKAGKIDRILCKSVSRFSRNVTECQRFVELLRSMNIVVEFEKENIRTNDPTSNLLFSLMCSIAQDESRSISENIRMGYQARYKRGEYNLGNNRILGYDCVCGKLVPNQDAWIVRMVFDLFLKEKTYKEIAESLEKAGAESQRKCGHFSGTIISYILRNETYVGDKRLHKNPPRDFITKKVLKDTDFESIYLTNDHESIVDRKTWDAVQTILNQREELKKKGVDVRGKNSHFLFGKVKCGECGEYYTRRTFQERRRDENGKPMTYKVWVCKEKRKGKKGNGCQNRGIREDVLLQEIAEQLGWDTFDEKRFEEVVECVVVSKSDIYIKMKNE